MAFNHYAKLKRLLEQESTGWYIRRIDQPTNTLNFKNERVYYDHYYRIYRDDDTPLKYGKFQKLNKLASVLGVEVGDLPIIEGLPMT